MGYIARILGVLLAVHVIRTVQTLILSSFNDNDNSLAYHHMIYTIIYNSILLVVFGLPVSFVLCAKYNPGVSKWRDAILVIAAMAYNSAIIYELIITAPTCCLIPAGPCEFWHKIRFLMSISVIGEQLLGATGFLLIFCLKKRQSSGRPRMAYELPEHVRGQDLNTSSGNENLDVPSFLIDAPSDDDPLPYSDNSGHHYLERDLSSISTELPANYEVKVSVDPQFMLKTMECQICMHHYNTRHRLPKAMRCQHTLCQICIGKLVTNGYIKCPQCREITQKDEVRTNYALKDILEGLCEVCFSHQRSAMCEHCHHQLCDECLQDHILMPKRDALARHCSLTGSAGVHSGADTDTVGTQESQESDTVF